MNLADLRVADPLPFTRDANAAPVAGFGELDSVPTETGTLMAGLGTEGKPGVATTGPGGGSREGVIGGRGHGGKPGRRAKANSTDFFGTEAVGDRIVFLVDNSGSMKQGRMETTVHGAAAEHRRDDEGPIVLHRVLQRRGVSDVLSEERTAISSRRRRRTSSG